MKRCDKFLLVIDDYVDGELPDEERVAWDRHLQACASCRRELARVQDLLRSARTLPKWIEPHRDLWPGIHKRVESNAIGFAGEGRKRPGRAPFFWLTQAAAVALVVFVGFFVVDVGRGPALVEDDHLVSAVEQEYLAAKAVLLDELYAAEDDGLPPETISAVEENLRIIEEAATDIRLALADNPNNPHLERILIATYKSQVDLLQQAVLLAHRS